MLITTAADRDWSDLPLKTAYLPLLQSLIHYLSGGQRGTFDAGIEVGEPKVFPLSPSRVGQRLRIAKPDRAEKEVAITADKNQASAVFADNDLMGIYRVNASDRSETSEYPRVYAVNSPFLESRLTVMEARELQEKLSPITAQVLPIESLKDGGKRTDLSLFLLVLLIITLVLEGWLAQRL
jgi:hypothetical protein